ncbi:AfsR/SARP family transcriptional regulator [Kibdelosporangium persicum]|uniref:OmpR/PhoB-type domain-containing protein n=1 Tax=Kibdelosporangium persicum TaxID=2698649 RepID=A0ABX2FG27_9PSEU|nr:AfsR/SARP family transcriptional regulator [Kibdelosporangium persicum]NRN70332.1 hypothetical protein [Kibdelosporangium persicum]
MTDVFIGVLGELHVRVGGREMRIAGRKQQLLLTALALSSGAVVTVEELIDRLWDDNPPPSARSTLRGHVKRLRRLLRVPGGQPVVETANGGYRLRVDPEAIDLYRFRRLIGQTDAPKAVLAEAIDLWRGPALHGLGPSRWAEQTALGLEEEWLQAIERLSDLDIDTGAPEPATARLGHLLGDHPFRESLWYRFILALHRAGRGAEALNRFDEIRRHLADRLGVEPSAPLRDLHQEILASTQDRQTSVKPRPGPTEFVGRKKEIARLDELSERARIIVVDGGAGVGKSELVSRWADVASARFGDKVVRINLRGFHPEPPLSTNEALVELLCGLGVAADDVPADVPARTALLRAELSRTRTLVILDNALNGHQVRPLLGGSESLTIITSRGQLRGLVAREGACRLTVCPLDLSESRQLVTALVGRPMRTEELALVDELAELCAGMPLALRIAIEKLTRIPEMSLVRLVGELCDVNGRLDLLETGDDCTTSVRAVLSRSQRLLCASEVNLLHRLSCLRKSVFDVNDVMLLADVPPREARATLNKLVSLGFLEQRGLQTYRMHALQRAVAQETPGTVSVDGVQQPSPATRRPLASVQLDR